MNRRGFLKGLAGIFAAGVAPAVVGSDILMPVRDLVLPSQIDDEVFVAIVHPDAQDWLQSGMRGWARALFAEASRPSKIVGSLERWGVITIDGRCPGSDVSRC